MSTTEEFYTRLEELHRLSGALRLLRWDQAVNMPSGGAEGRAQQVECLSSLMHEKRCDPAFIAVVDELSEDIDALSDAERIDVQEIKRTLDRARRLPAEFIARGARLKSTSYSAWEAAKKADDFAMVKPFLTKIVELNREEADLVGYEEHPYDALLDVFEPHERLSSIKPLLENVAEELKSIVPAILDTQDALPAFSQVLPIERQHAIGTSVAELLGFSFSTGRIDTSAHPFESSIGKSDVRITTRYEEDNFLSSLYSTMHEVGHALYELGLPQDRLATPLGSSISLGIHESQSRFWENFVGRSQQFTGCIHRILNEIAPEVHATCSARDLWAAVNWIQPSLIRVEADEVTYSLHVVIRTLLEEQLITGDLSVDELPDAWNDLYQQYLGVSPSDDKNGVMQDVHWYQGAIGYFPTYVLGNFYAAMFLEQLEKDVPSFWQDIDQGNCATGLNWLRTNIHTHGKRYRAAELVQRVVGRPLEIEPFLRYLRNKFDLKQ